MDLTCLRTHVPRVVMDRAGATVGDDVESEEPRERYGIAIGRCHHGRPEHNLFSSVQHRVIERFGEGVTRGIPAPPARRQSATARSS